MGIDNNPFFLKIAQKLHPSHQFLLGEQQKINLSENTADLIFNIAAFHHLPSPKLRLQAIKEMYRVLKPGGKIVLTCWNLWQKKYWTPIFTGYLRALVSMGEYSPNDLFIKWKNGKSALASRYYYAFSNSELAKLFLKNGFQILENFSVVDNQRVKAGQGFNFCFILQKNA